MRPRSIQGVPGLDDPALTPFERLKRFAGMIVRVPKAETEKEMEKPNTSKMARQRKGNHASSTENKKKEGSAPHR